MIKINLYIMLLFIALNGSELFYYNSGEKITLLPVETKANSLRKLSIVKSDPIKYFKTNSNVVLGINNEIIIKTKNIEKILKKYNLQLKKVLFLNVYLIELKDNNSTLDIANLLYKDKDILYSHPNFIRQVNKR